MTAGEVLPERAALSTRARRLEPAPIAWMMEQALGVPGLLSLAAGFVDETTLPAAELSLLVERVLGDPETAGKALQYGTSAGEPELRTLLLERLAAAGSAEAWRGVGADDLAITAGSQQLLYHLAEALLDPGDLVLVENPTYFVYVGVLRSFDCRLVGIEGDAEGMSPEALDRTLERLDADGALGRTKMVYLMSYFQNPMGTSIPVARQRRLWAVLEKWFERGLPALVVEDAAYRGLRFPEVDDHPPLFELQGGADRVAYVDSFSKVLSPGLRLGYGVLPRWIRDEVLAIKGHLDFGSSRFVQQLVLEALRAGVCDRHLERLRSRYRDKAFRLREVLELELGDRVSILEPRGGLYLWMTLRDGTHTGRDGELIGAALEEGVLYVPSDVCSVEDEAGGGVVRDAMRLCHAYPGDDDLVEAGRRLARAVRRVCG